MSGTVDAPTTLAAALVSSIMWMKTRGSWRSRCLNALECASLFQPLRPMCNSALIYTVFTLPAVLKSDYY